MVGGKGKARRHTNSRKPILAHTTLGFTTYQAYLCSPMWKTIRRRNIRKTCELCGGPPHSLHHIKYDIATMRGLKPWNLVTLCSNCHNKCHFDESGKKEPFHRVSSKSIELLDSVGKWKQRVEQTSFRSVCNMRPPPDWMPNAKTKKPKHKKKKNHNKKKPAFRNVALSEEAKEKLMNALAKAWRL